MQKILTWLIVFGLFCSQSVNAAENTANNELGGPYIKVGTGMMCFEKFKAKAGYSKKRPRVMALFNLGIGHKITESIRSDLDFNYGEILYKGNKSKQRSNMIGVLATGHYDIISISKSTTPYVSIGAGFARTNAGTLVNTETTRKVYPGKSATDFVWNVGLGIKFNIDKDYTLDLGYRYAELGEIKVANQVADNGTVSKGASQKMKGHQGLLSLLYKF